MNPSDDPGPCSTAGGSPARATEPFEVPGLSGQYFWVWVLCLLGLDYFSTLAYQPSITYEVAGPLGPLATVVVVLITLAGALPIYCYLARKSPGGAGAIGLLERLVRGWKGKTLVLLLLGFAATDFTMLKTLSLADAAQHLIKSEDGAWQHNLREATLQVRAWATAWLGADVGAYFTEQLSVTLMLGVLGFIFWFLLRRGFSRNVLVLAVPLVVVYLLLNAVVLGAGILQLAGQPDLITSWWRQVHDGPWGHVRPPFELGFGWGSVALVSLLFLPKLALGLSGFEMSMIVMPQVQGKDGEEPPRTRIRNTRKVLIAAAVIMAVYLVASSVVTALLIPPPELLGEGRAVNRALAYLAHGGRINGAAGGLLPWGDGWLGTLYDVTTVLMLCLAGSSVMTALNVLLPQFLLRFGMEFRWAHKWGVLLILFAVVNMVITVYFQASVEAQRDAYASGVLVLIACASVATALARRKELKEQTEPPTRLARASLLYYRVAAGCFSLLSVAVLIHSASGVVIAELFILALLATSVLSRAVRADEMRTVGFEFKNQESKFLWDSLRLADFPVLVPHRPGRHVREAKEKQIRADHQLDPEVNIAFLEVEVDDPSNFFQTLLIEIIREERRFVIKVTRCVSVAHAIAAIALEMSKESRPQGLHFGWAEMDLLTTSWNYFAFGEGNVPSKVRELILRVEPEPSRRPRVIVG